MIAIVFALEFESAVFCAKQDRRMRVAVWQMGAMGKAAAGILERKLVDNRPSLVISAGFAGGLQSHLAAGDLVIGRNFTDPDILARLNLGPDWHIGEIHTASAIIERAEDKRNLAQETGCMVGDLETSHIAAVCQEHGIPMLALRCISDTADEDMPVPASALLNPATGRPEPLQLFRHLIANPSSVSGFSQLLKNAKTAQKNLARGLNELLPQLLRVV